jgi:hypothetical protein
MNMPSSPTNSTILLIISFLLIPMLTLTLIPVSAL